MSTMFKAEKEDVISLWQKLLLLRVGMRVSRTTDGTVYFKVKDGAIYVFKIEPPTTTEETE